MEVQRFISQNSKWVIEGCYADLLVLVRPYADEVVFMNLPVERCQENGQNRPWEPHKYPAKAAQDANLPMLLDWIVAYPTRTDALSYTAHRALYDAFQGKKSEITSNRSLHGKRLYFG